MQKRVRAQSSDVKKARIVEQRKILERRALMLKRVGVRSDDVKKERSAD